MAETVDTVIEEIKEIQRQARQDGKTERPFWPMIVLRTPKGWTGPKVVDGKGNRRNLQGTSGTNNDG